MGFLSVLTGVTSALSPVANIWDSIQNRKVAKQNAQLEYESNKYAVDETNRANKELAQYQNDYNTNMWHMQNAYNSPVNQSRLYEEAGFNKQAILGNIDSSAATPQPAASYTPDYSRYQSAPAAVAPLQFSEMLNTALDSYQKVLNLKQQEAALKGQQTDNALRDLDYQFESRSLEDRIWRQYFNTRISGQTFSRRGGYYNDKDTATIKDAFIKGLGIRNDLLTSQKDYYNTQRDTLKGYLQPLYSSLKTMNENRNYEFDKVRKPFIDTFGATSPYVDHSINKAIDEGLSAMFSFVNPKGWAKLIKGLMKNK